jgi:hypothetical protein
MAMKKKGIIAPNGEHRRHPEARRKRQFWKRERRAAKNFSKQEARRCDE